MRNNRGFTLVEVMLALLILLFITLAMMQFALVSIDSNMKNVLRDEAVRIAEASMNDARSTGYDGLSAGTTTATVSRNFRDIANFAYTTTSTVTQLSNAKEVDINVSWTWKQQTFTHTVSTLMRKP